jgi:hypothetical protein
LELDTWLGGDDRKRSIPPLLPSQNHYPESNRFSEVFVARLCFTI